MEVERLLVRKSALEQRCAELRQERAAAHARCLGLEGRVEGQRAEQAAAAQRLRRLLEEDLPLEMAPPLPPTNLDLPLDVPTVGLERPPGIF
mmetsp:Transcript_9383/g.29845  ORF Transcript_9383/g.29845 Transcript_9383/m.29845 type:complete len:92 (+) Transcript_9383:67-342(+)